MTPPDKYYRVDITRYPALSREAEVALFTGYRKRRTDAKREKIVRQYLYWAAELACRYQGPRMPKPDAISAANYGLMQAIEKFDPSLGRRFVTYSYFLIRREILYALRDSYVVNPESGLWASGHRFKISDKTAGDAEQLAKERREIFDSVCAPTSIGVQSDRGGPADDENLFCEEAEEDGTEQRSLIDALREMLPKLPEELRRTIELRYFPTGKTPTFAEIGVQLGCSTNNARWRHDRAILLLQKRLRSLKKEL